MIKVLKSIYPKPYKTINALFKILTKVSLIKLVTTVFLMVQENASIQVKTINNKVNG